jgi:hypothetical protein
MSLSLLTELASGLTDAGLRIRSSELAGQIIR